MTLKTGDQGVQIPDPRTPAAQPSVCDRIRGIAFTSLQWVMIIASAPALYCSHAGCSSASSRSANGIGTIDPTRRRRGWQMDWVDGTDETRSKTVKDPTPATFHKVPGSPTLYLQQKMNKTQCPLIIVSTLHTTFEPMVNLLNFSSTFLQMVC